MTTAEAGLVKLSDSALKDRAEDILGCTVFDCSGVDIGEVDDLKKRKIIDRGMLPKINGAIRALHLDVQPASRQPRGDGMFAENAHTECGLAGGRDAAAVGEVEPCRVIRRLNDTVVGGGTQQYVVERWRWSVDQGEPDQRQ
jgi:hypothetical protein